MEELIKLMESIKRQNAQCKLGIVAINHNMKQIKNGNKRIRTLKIR